MIKGVHCPKRGLNFSRVNYVVARDLPSLVIHPKKIKIKKEGMIFFPSEWV